jgi:hypothetical protein
MTAILVYLLCAVTCGACTLLLLRGYWVRRSRLLYWCALAFCAFGVGNILLCVDLLLVPQMDLMFVRNLVTLLGVVLMLRGLISEEIK